MHILQPKHIKLSDEEAEKLLSKLNVSKTQLPKILLHDSGLPEDSKVGDIIKIERKTENSEIFDLKQSKGKMVLYYRVVV